MSQTQTERSFERKFLVDGQVTVEARLDTGAVRIKPGNAGTVEIRGVLRRRGSSFLGLSDDVEDRMDYLAANAPVSFQGGTIRLGDLNDDLLDGISTLMEVTVPHETRVRARSDHADFHIEGIQGPLECETDHGNVDAIGIGAGVRVTTDHGRIAIRGVQGPVSVQADSGDVEAIEIAGRIDIRVDSARVAVSQTAAAPIRVEADSGDVIIRLAGDAGYDVSIETDHGKIRVPPLEGQQLRDGRIRGRLRGGGPLVEARTDSGNIEVE